MTPTRKIGLVLGGGGARGFAHVGVLRALEERSLEPDFIFGCSMGGIIGALAACGLGGARIQEIVEKKLGARALAPGKGGSFLGSAGIARVLREHLCDRFEELEIPFAVTTVDLHSGELVVLDSGKLMPALRATIAIPGILPAYEIDDRALADGGLLNNLPVDLIRKRTTSPVVAVNVGEPANRPLDLSEPSLWHQMGSLIEGDRPLTADLFMKAFLIPQADLTRRRLRRHPPDVLITPELPDDFVMESFRRRDLAIEAGYQAAIRALPKLDEPRRERASA